ncbi:MAG: DNA repair protein RecO [Chloroflexi bacterium]|nr:MAG: DNA repair protein RecO [Chloroflexota bacterium]
MRTWRKELGTYRDRAVVLRKLDYGEADRIFTLLTRDHGKVGAIAKGVRRQESKLGPSLELYGHIDVLLAKGRGELDVVAQVQRVPGYRIAGDMERMAHAALIAELAERVCEDRHPIDGLVPLAVIKVLRLMAAGDIETYRRVKLDGPLMASIEGVLQSQLEYHMDRRLKSIAFLNSMRV